MRGFSIRFKITSVIILSLFLTTLVILYISTINQKKGLKEASERTLSTSAALLNVSIRSLMLSGEAPIAVQTMDNLKNIQGIEELELFRTDGTRAFHDHATLEKVNRNLGNNVFEKTERLAFSSMVSDVFRDVLASNAPKRVELRDVRAMEYYYPVINSPECMKCHGSDHRVRGIIYAKISTKSLYDQIRKANLLLVGIFVMAGILIWIVIVMLLRRIVAKPLLEIGEVVRGVTDGNFDRRILVRRMDEIGKLGEELNTMIRGLEERYHLSKYVSKTTEELIKQRRYVSGEGEKQDLAVLFSDIRNFTVYSEQHPPSEVIKTLNRILEAQATCIEQWQGDIDKFIGDSVMALFTSEYSAVQCAYHMIQSVTDIDRKLRTGLRIGIGINSGVVLLGNIGSEHRFEYAAIGDTINVAARMSGLARPNMMLVSESVKRALEGKLAVKIISDHMIRGKTSKMNFYIVQSVLDEETSQWMR